MKDLFNYSTVYPANKLSNSSYITSLTTPLMNWFFKDFYTLKINKLLILYFNFNNYI